MFLEVSTLYPSIATKEVSISLVPKLYIETYVCGSINLAVGIAINTFINSLLLKKRGRFPRP
jgi:uncharacterized membrane protein